jgi:hypothetical protein
MEHILEIASNPHWISKLIIVGVKQIKYLVLIYNHNYPKIKYLIIIYNHGSHFFHKKTNEC